MWTGAQMLGNSLLAEDQRSELFHDAQPCATKFDLTGVRS
jgi:hypothetical protein